jgi:hypothetical protein
LQGFYYANGVALSPDESFVVMAETDAIRAHKIWVKGLKVMELATAASKQYSVQLASKQYRMQLAVKPVPVILLLLSVAAAVATVAVAAGRASRGAD